MEGYWGMLMIAPICGILTIIVGCLLMGACYSDGQTGGGSRHKLLRLLVNKVDSTGRDEASQNLRANTPPPEYESIFSRESAEIVYHDSVLKVNK